MVPESAASMLNPNPDEALNLGGSTRVNGLAVFRRFKIPIRFRVGERPAGAVKGVFEMLVLRRGAGARAGRIGRRGLGVAGLRVEKSLGDGGAFVRKKLIGFCRVSTLDPSGDLNFLGERKRVGSRFSVSSLSKEEALRLLGAERVEIAAESVVRFIV
jgi:hypothetical protein